MRGSCVDYVWLSLGARKKLKNAALSANFVALLTRNAVVKRCVFADLYTWYIYNTLCNHSSHILTKFMDAQQRTALIFVT